VSFPLVSNRLRVRHWRLADTAAAVKIYGVADPTGWHTPATHKAGDHAAMRAVLSTWVEEQPELPAPQGRWAVERRSDEVVVGGLAIRLIPPAEEDLEISFQLDPAEWGHGYAVEAAHALMGWAFSHDIDELFGVVAPNNSRAIATMNRLSMQWVGETAKYYEHTLLVYRIRPAQLPALPRRPPGPPAAQGN
jgi:RimJ/RimL family protein N-acetyltransferase